MPFLNSSLAPSAMLNTPVLVPPPPGRKVPAFTLTVPVLLKATLRAVVVFDCLLKVPLLLKMPPPLPALMLLSKVLASVKVPALLKLLAPDMRMVLLLPVLPDQVVLPAFRERPPASDLLVAPLIPACWRKWCSP